MIEKRDVLIVARTWKRKVKIDIGDPTRDEIDNNIMGILLRNYGRPSAEPAEMFVVCGSSSCIMLSAGPSAVVECVRRVDQALDEQHVLCSTLFP